MAKRLRQLRKKKIGRFDNYIPGDGDSDNEADNNDEVFLQVRVMVFCISI